MDQKQLKQENDLIDFLWESNAIEEVEDDDSFAQALKAWQYLDKHDKLSVEILNKTHGILMKNQPLDKEAKGQFRKCAVWIGGREGKPWYALPELMEQWVVNVNDVIINGQHENEKFLEKVIKEQHVLLEVVHPWIDGNGRCGRLVMNWTRIKVKLPILVIKEKEKKSYYAWFGKGRVAQLDR